MTETHIQDYDNKLEHLKYMVGVARSYRHVVKTVTPFEGSPTWGNEGLEPLLSVLSSTDALDVLHQALNGKDD